MANQNEIREKILQKTQEELEICRMELAGILEDLRDEEPVSLDQLGRWFQLIVQYRLIIQYHKEVLEAEDPIQAIRKQIAELKAGKNYLTGRYGGPLAEAAAAESRLFDAVFAESRMASLIGYGIEP